MGTLTLTVLVLILFLRARLARPHVDLPLWPAGTPLLRRVLSLPVLHSVWSHLQVVQVEFMHWALPEGMTDADDETHQHDEYDRLQHSLSLLSQLTTMTSLRMRIWPSRDPIIFCLVSKLASLQALRELDIASTPSLCESLFH